MRPPIKTNSASALQLVTFPEMSLTSLKWLERTNVEIV